MKLKAHITFAVALCLALLLTTTGAHAAGVNVNCDRGDTIQGALKQLTPAGPNRVNVSGTCKENVKINALDRLLLIADPSATILDPSGGVNDAIDIFGSRDVKVQGFV